VLEVYFRHHGKQVHRRIGPAWTKRGRPPEGYFDKAAAYDRARAIIAEHVAAVEPRSSGPTFRNVARAYLQWLENVRGAKPETLRNHRSTLGEPDVAVNRGSATTNGHVMRALGDRPATGITPAEVEAVLATVEATGVGPRTVNKYRATVSAAFAYAQKPTTFALEANPAKATDRRREAQRPALDTYTVAEVAQLAAALARAGTATRPARPPATPTAPRTRRTRSWSALPPTRGCAKASCARCAGATSARMW
jgi:hypothetical protein